MDMDVYICMYEIYIYIYIYIYKLELKNLDFIHIYIHWRQVQCISIDLSTNHLTAKKIFFFRFYKIFLCLYNADIHIPIQTYMYIFYVKYDN